MMLEAFTWQTFLVAALILSLIWYTAVGLIYYRSEISAFLSGDRSKSNEPLPHGWAHDVDDLGPDLMGKQKEEDGVSVVEADEFSFAPSEPPVLAVDPLGELADIQQEIKSICNILENEDGTKDDFFAMFAIIRNKYLKVAASKHLPELNEFIRDHAPFYLSEEELESLWI